MRADFDRVVIERPRYNSSDCYGNYRRANNRGDLEDLPTVQGMRRPHNTKELSDLLGPLKRFLRSRVGQRWDDVWSEICRAFRSGNVIHQHIRDHARQFVEIQTFEVDGKPHVGHRLGHVYPVRGFYVDPNDGRLRYAEYARYRYDRSKPDRLDRDGRHFARLEGIWYEYFTRPCPPKRFRENRHGGYWYDVYVYDVIEGYEVNHSVSMYGKRSEYAYAKRQMNRKDLRRFGLVNQPEGD